MGISELLRTAFRSLRANRKRSFLTIIGILIGIAAVITILGIGNGITKTMYDQFGNHSKTGEQTTEIFFASTNDSTVNGFNQEDIDNLKRQFAGQFKSVRIEHETANLNQTAMVGMTNKRISVSLLRSPTKDIKLVAGHQPTRAQYSAGKPVAMMKEAVAKKQYGTAQNALGTTVEVGKTTYRVVGVYHNQAAYTLEGGANKFGVDLLLPKQVYYQGSSATSGNTIKLIFDQGQHASKVSSRVAKYLKKNGSAASKGLYQYEDMEKELKQFASQMKIITSFISFIAAISLFIAGIGVMNMMYISVSERTQEIGIRLAVGATPGNIMMQFLIEAVVLTVTGGLLGFLCGAGLAHLIAPLMAHAIGNGVHLHAHVTIGSFLLAFGTSASVGLIFGILPARQAANKNLIDILR